MMSVMSSLLLAALIASELSPCAYCTYRAAHFSVWTSSSWHVNLTAHGRGMDSLPGSVQSIGTMNAIQACAIASQPVGRLIPWNVLQVLQLTLRTMPSQRRALSTPPGSPLTNKMASTQHRPKNIIIPRGM